jgi:hypothetical protein
MHWKRLLCICWWCRCSPASIYLLAFIRAVVQKKAWIRWTMETRQSITMTWIASYLQMCGLDNTIIKVFIMSRLVLWSHILQRTIVFRMLADYRHLLWVSVDRFRQPSFNHYSVRQLERNQPLPRVHWPRRVVLYESFKLQVTIQNLRTLQGHFCMIITSTVSWFACEHLILRRCSLHSCFAFLETNWITGAKYCMTHTIDSTVLYPSLWYY